MLVTAWSPAPCMAHGTWHMVGTVKNSSQQRRGDSVQVLGALQRRARATPGSEPRVRDTLPSHLRGSPGRRWLLSSLNPNLQQQEHWRLSGPRAMLSLLPPGLSSPSRSALCTPTDGSPGSSALCVLVVVGDRGDKGQQVGALCAHWSCRGHAVPLSQGLSSSGPPFPLPPPPAPHTGPLGAALTPRHWDAAPGAPGKSPNPSAPHNPPVCDRDSNGTRLVGHCYE